MALDFLNNGNLSAPKCAHCGDWIGITNGKWEHPKREFPSAWHELADKNEDFGPIAGHFFKDVTSDGDGAFKDVLHQAEPHDGRTIKQDMARQELENYDVVAHPEREGYTKADVEGQVDIEPKLFPQNGNVSKQFSKKRYSYGPPNKRNKK